LKRDGFKLVMNIIMKIVIVLAVLIGMRCLFTESFYIRAVRPLLISSALIVISGYFFSSQKKYFMSVTVLGTLFCSVLYIKVLVQEVLTYGMFNEIVSFSIGIVNAVLLTFLLFESTQLSKMFVLIILYMPLVLFWSYYFSSGAWISVDTVMAILQTNVSESCEYISDTMTFSGCIGLLTLSGLVLLSAWIASSLEKKNVYKYGSVFLVAFVVANAIFAYRHRNNIVTDIVVQTKLYTEKYNDFEKQKTVRKTSLKNGVGRIANVGDGVYVLVIGESQNRNNMSAYGYQRKTTPWLESMKHIENFIIFDKAYSCHTHTVPVLTYALTAKNQYNDLKLGESVSLLEVVEAAGFETVWISNQVKYSAWDTPVTVIADEANQQFWHNNNVGEKTATNHYDLKLVESIEKIKITDKMLIVFHLMGNHGSYRERYPKDFKKFNGRKTLDEYDNSILYNDYVVQNLFEKVRELPNFKGFVYFADHADAVLQGLAHDASKFVPEMTHVPMYMYFDKSYVREFEEKVYKLNDSRSTVFTNDLAFNTILSIMDIQVDSVYEAHNDIVSDEYDANVQRFKTLYGKKQICIEGK